VTPCAAPRCEKRAQHHSNDAGYLCRLHYRRWTTYGELDWAPILFDRNTDVPQAIVDDLVAMPWPELVAYCDMVRQGTIDALLDRMTIHD
jgi:hypothetical protein